MPEVVSIIIKGGVVMIPLLACSLISVALTIERIIFWTRLKSKDVWEQILSLVENGDFQPAFKLGKTSRQPIARVLAAGIAHRNPTPAKAMEAAAQAEIPVLKSRLGVLDTIVTLAPLLGLLGTVVGMIGSFKVMSVTGVILMYEPQITEYSEWNARWVTPPGPEAKRLPLEDLVAKARAANPAARPAAITLKPDPAASVLVNLDRENSVLVNPYTGELLGGISPTHHFMHEVVSWHRWLGMEDDGRTTGKAITGACNLAFFWLTLTGVYLWWPHNWKWRGLKTSLLINVRLTGKARDWNWHNVIGFWSSSVLVVLTLTAAVMSYSWANDLLYTLTGSEPPARAQRPAGPNRRTGRSSVGAEAKTPAKPIASFDALRSMSKAVATCVS